MRWWPIFSTNNPILFRALYYYLQKIMLSNLCALVQLWCAMVCSVSPSLWFLVIWTTYLFRVMHVTEHTKKGEAFPAYHSHDGFPAAAFPAYHMRISICAHLGHSILPSIRQTAISFHAYICLFSIAFLLLMMISWFHHFFRYELLSNVGIPHCLFFLLAH